MFLGVSQQLVTNIQQWLWRVHHVPKIEAEFYRNLRLYALWCTPFGALFTITEGRPSHFPLLKDKRKHKRERITSVCLSFGALFKAQLPVRLTV